MTGALVKRVQKPAPTAPRRCVVQRACSCGRGSSDTCSECENKRKLRRSVVRTGATSWHQSIPSIARDVPHTSGRSLDPPAAAAVEPRLGHHIRKIAVAGAHTPTMADSTCDDGQSLMRAGPLPSLTVTGPGDACEQEADRLAAQVLTVSAGKQAPHTPPVRQLPQRASYSGEAPPIVHDVLAKTGEPLPSSTRTFFETRFGHDFSKTRVHADTLAAESATALHALAYTVGEHIAFAPGHYSPYSVEGRALLAHELTHVIQQRASGEMGPVQRSLEGCRNLIEDEAVSLLSGTVVHRIIAADFQRRVAGARRGVVIPGASAGPLRTGGLCGKPDPVVDPQVVGGMSGAGFPDLARITSGGILQVGEIKPAAIVCLIDGEEQALRYIDQGNAQDPQQAAWRASQGISVVSPMPESAYSPPSFRVSIPGVGSAELRTAWCTPGLLAYSVKLQGQPIPVPVPQPQRASERERLRDAARRYAPAVATAAVGAVAIVAGRALWRHFWRVVVQRFAVRGAVAVALSAADGPLPFGELVSLGLAIVTVIQIVDDWNDLWREADRLAAEGA